jgi:hypothetical protein
LQQNDEMGMPRVRESGTETSKWAIHETHELAGFEGCDSYSDWMNFDPNDDEHGIRAGQKS